MGNLHQGGSQHPFVEPITWLHLFDNSAFFVLIRLLTGDRLVLVGIELLANRRDGRESLRLEGLLELPRHGLDPL